MQESTSREKVLKKIRNALIGKSPNPFPDLQNGVELFEETGEPHELVFARAFKSSGGNFIYCADKLEFAELFVNLVQEQGWDNIVCTDNSIRKFLKEIDFPIAEKDHKSVLEAEVLITGCECLIAGTGSIMVSSLQDSGRSGILKSRIHIIVAQPHQMVWDIHDAMTVLTERYEKDLPSSVSIITGPSRTADIGNEVVTGAQGPERVFLYMIDKPF